MEKNIASKKIRRRILSLICVLFSALFAFLFCVVLVLKTTLYNEKFYVNILQNTKYCEYLSENIKADLVHLGQISMEESPDGIFKNAVPTARVLNASLVFFKASVNHTLEKIDTQTIKQELTDNLSLYISERYPEIADDAETKENLNLLVQSCVQAYSEEIKVDFMPVLGSLIAKTGGYIDAVIVIMAALSLLFAGILFPLNRKTSKKLMYFVILSSTTFLAIAVVPAFLFGSNIVSKASITSKSLYTLVTAILSGIGTQLLIAALVVAVITVAAIVFNAMYNKYRGQ